MNIMGTSTHGSENGSEDSYPTLGNSLHSDRWERGTVQSEASSQGQGQGLDRYVDRAMGSKGHYGGNSISGGGGGGGGHMAGGMGGARSHQSHRQASQSRFLTSQSIAAYFGRVEGGNMRTLPLSLSNPDETLDSIGATLDLLIDDHGHHSHHGHSTGLDRLHSAQGQGLGLGQGQRRGQGLGEESLGQWSNQNYRPVFVWNRSFLSGTRASYKSKNIIYIQDLYITLPSYYNTMNDAVNNTHLIHF